SDDGNAEGPSWEELRYIEPPIGDGLLATPAKVKRLGIDGYIARALDLRASLHVAKEALDRDLIDKAHAASLPVRAFTVNEREHISHCRELGVDAIFTDFPERAR